MKGPIDLTDANSHRIVASSQSASRRSQRSLPKVPGGKALARIRLFRLQRYLNTGTGDPDSNRPLAATHLIGLEPVVAGAQAAHRVHTRATSQSPYLAAFDSMNRLAKRPVVAAAAATVPASWRPLGPFSIPHGQTYGEGTGSRPSVSGRVTAVAIDPSDPNHVLIGAAGGGIWESRDFGIAWLARTDDQASLSIGAVVFDPNAPSVVYAGTGEGDSRSPLGVGLLRSNNGGQDWHLHAIQPFAGQAFFDLLVDRTDSRHLLAACTHGLYRSTDGGATWDERRAAMTYDLSMRVAGDGFIEFLAGCADGLFESRNGADWTFVPLVGEPEVFGRVEVVHAPSEGSVAYVFGANELDDGSITQGFLWRRGTSDGEFQPIPMPTDLDVSQAWYDWFAAVAPNNPDVIYLGAINVHKGVRSATGRWSWTNISAKTDGDSIHPDQHAIAFNPRDANDLIIGNDGGVYRSRDGGISWRPLNLGLNITEFEYLAQHPDLESWLLAGTQDNGTLRYQNQPVWYLVQDGDGGDCGVNRTRPHTCFHSFYGMYLERSTQGGAWATWTDTELPASNDEGLFYPPVEVNGNTVAKAGQRVYVSRKNGRPGSWARIGIPGDTLGTALAIPKPSLIYVGTDNGDLFKVKFSGGAWSPATALTRPRNGYVSDLSVDPSNARRIWVTYSNMSGGHVFRSDDAGAQWKDVSGSLPEIPVNAIELDPQNSDTVFVAADVGVYRSDDAGANWEAYNRNLPNALVKDLLFHAESRLLRAATQSRGVWEIPVDSADQSAVEIYVRDNVVDSGRLTPSPSNVDDPFDVGHKVFWWESPDIKIDAPSFQAIENEDVNFEMFEDDQSMQEFGIEFATGLRSESPQPGQPVRVYVQVHNRGVQPATDTDVRVFVTEASATLPKLPRTFWDNFPNNAVPANSPWQPLAPHKTIASIDAGRSKVIGFDWQLPLEFTEQLTLLAISSATNDSIRSAERDIAELVLREKKCALRSCLIVNPPAQSGPTRSIVPIRLPSRARKPLAVRLVGKTTLVRGLILPKAVVRQSRRSLKRVSWNGEDREELQRLIDNHPEWADALDLRCAYTKKRTDKSAPLLDTLAVSDLADDFVILLLNRKPRPGRQALLIEDEDGKLMGGFTFYARPGRRVSV